MVTKTHMILTGICATIFLILGIGGPFLINYIVTSQAGDEAKMTPENFSLWGEVPGELGAQIYRNHTFYTLQNQKDVIYKQAQPVFEETRSYDFQEFQNFTEPIYSDSGDEVNFQFFQQFQAVGNTTGDELVECINVGAMGAWNQMKQATFDQICLQAMGELFMSLKEQMDGSILGIGMVATLFPTYDKSKERLGKITPKLTDEQINAILTDKAYGLNADTNFAWVEMSFKFNDKNQIQERPSGEGTFTFLQNYFGISFEQLEAIKKLIFNGKGTAFGVKTLYTTLVQGKGLYSTVVKGAYCKVYKDFDCDSNLLASAQWTVQGVTYDTPVIAGIELPHIPSIGSVNATVYGYPELSYYFQEAFANPESPYFVEGGDGSAFKNMFEDKNYWVAWGLEAMKTLPGDEFVTTPHALLNCGNLRTLINYGEKFDDGELPYTESPYMKKFQKKLNVDTPEKAFFFWNYMKYLTFEFAEMKLQGGGPSNAVGGALVGGGLADSYEKLQNSLVPFMVAKTQEKMFQQQTCMDLMSLAPFDKSIALHACEDMFKLQKGDNLSFDNYLTLLQVCTKQNPDQRDLFVTVLGVEDDVLTQFCNSDGEGTISQAYTAIQLQLAQYYQCQYKTYCTSSELSVLQWRDSTITKSQPEIMSGVFPPALSIMDWFPETFDKQFEFGWFMQDYKDVLTQFGEDIFQPTIQQSKSLLTYDKLLSGTVTGAAFVWIFSEDPTLNAEVKKQLYWTNNQQLLTYMRYCAIELGFGGFTIVRPSKEILFGYEDPFLLDLRDDNPQVGGDPSIDPVIFLSDLNMTSPEVAQSIEWKQGMYTGEGDLQDLRLYSEISGSKYVKVVTPFFDGEQVVTILRNPYKEDIEINGNDGSASFPDQKKGDVNNVYIQSIYKTFRLVQQGKVKHHGLDTYRYVVPADDLYNCENNKENCPFYMDGPNGLINMTSIMGAPVYNSLTHFYLGDEQLYNNITVYKDGNLQFPNEWDATYIDSEIYSGVTFAVVLNLQINYEIQPDMLFPVEFNRYLPIYYMYRGTNLTESQINSQYSDLKVALGFKLGLLIGGIALGIMMVGVFAYQVKRYRSQKTDGQQETTELDEQQEQLNAKLVKQENGVNPNFSTRITDYNN